METQIPAIYSELRGILSSQLEEAEGVSYTADIWSRDSAIGAMISLTAHFTSTTSWDRKNLVLCIRSFPGIFIVLLYKLIDYISYGYTGVVGTMVMDM